MNRRTSYYEKFELSEYDVMQAIAQNLRYEMERIGITQSQLAKETGLSQATISNCLNARKMMSVRALMNISVALCIEFGDLLPDGGNIMIKE